MKPNWNSRKLVGVRTQRPIWRSYYNAKKIQPTEPINAQMNSDGPQTS